MAKFNLQQFLLAKGEKIGLGLAVGGLGLLGIWGVSNLISAKSPEGVKKNFEGYKQRLDAAVQKKEPGTVEPIPAWAKADALDAKALYGDDFPEGGFLFEPVDRPSRARDNPKVLGITEAQLDLVRLNMKAYDIKGTPGNYLIGVMDNVSIQGDKVTSKALKDLLKKFDPRDKVKKSRPPAQNQAGPPGFGGGGGPPPGMGGSAGGPPPGMGGSAGGPPPGMGGGMGGPGGAAGDMGSSGYGGNTGTEYQNNTNRIEKTVKYKPIEEFDPAKDEPAFIVYPKRVIVMHAVFPLKEQLEVVRRALRLKTIDEAAAMTGPNAAAAGAMAGTGTTPPGSAAGPRGEGMSSGMPGGTGATSSGGVKVPEGPTFAGFEVERRVTDPNGRAYPSADGYDRYDHVGWYLTVINNRKVADQPDDGYLPYFLRYEQEMAMPLPAVAEGQQTYPPITLPSIVRTVQKMKESQKVPVTPSELQKRFSGQGTSPFTPSYMPPAGAAGGAGIDGGYFGSGGSSMSIGSSRGMPPGMPGGAGMPPGMPGGQYGPGGPYNPNGMMPEIKAPVELEHMLIRFMDVTVAPGHTYEYRIRVKMKNPNYGIKNVSKPSDADIPILYGPWVTLANPGNPPTPMRVTVPYDSNTYLVDPVEYANDLRSKFKDRKVVELLDNQNGKLPVIEVQQWLAQVAIDDNKSEPIGAWVVGDIPVARGEFIGKKQLTTLPMWSSQKVRYILQELPRYKVGTGKDQPKGLLVDYTTSNICVDYEGGKTERQFNERRLEDDAAVEMLILNSDGSLSVRNSGVDMANPERKDRVQRWDDWIKKVKADTEAAGALGAPPPDPGFGGGRN